MGLFDTLHCEFPLPDGCAEREFQTKSLACEMDNYRLTAAGRLLHPGGQDTGFHGVLRFYTGSATGTWHEYEAKFTSGALQHLVPVASAAYSPVGFILPLPPAQP
ncbi:MAG: hypothetical protein KBF65_14565 [Rubrivivax sp.]|jgi:hypothetical protein|nr:hypothetical protein [Betaproteobacteria bacterium]MBP6320215.1 hypothetical protein [Rubrivivax sp.]MBK7460325.1 hypothetical protein [Betaproteobacteria bacterium]MBK7516249.1 hypothetical protein [Betaproteobacteria bacterium]MBK8107906.1 hypothetical protein [Betaproteobacteria bacterium]